MSALVVETDVTQEPVSLADMKNWLRVTITNDDVIIGYLITAARRAVEAFTGRSIAQKSYRQSLDSFPYFVDTIASQMAFPPSYYSLPRYSTTLWNYSQMIKLYAPPLISVQRISFLNAQGGPTGGSSIGGLAEWQDLVPAPLRWYPGTAYVPGNQVTDFNADVQTCTIGGTADHLPPNWSETLSGITTENTGVVWRNDGPASTTSFIVDADSEPGRLFPPAGGVWPTTRYEPNSVQIHYTAGYANGSVPKSFLAAIFLTVANWYENREAAAPGSFNELPNHLKMLLWSDRIYDMQPTRG